MIKKLIYNHLGLGDHIVVNGLIRELTKDYDRVYIFVKKHNLETVKHLYYEDKYNFISVRDDNEALEYCQINMINPLKIGFDKLDSRNQKFDESFYKQFNIPFEYRWSKFKMRRDISKEKDIFDYYKIKEKEYIFLHDDPKRNYKIDRNLIENKDLKIITPEIGLTENIIDFLYLIENSKEIHCMDSSFRLLIDNLKLSQNLYYHTYVRGRNNINMSSSKNNWKII